MSDWVYSGVFRDVYGEFMIQVNEEYLSYRGEETQYLHTHIYTHVAVSKPWLQSPGSENEKPARYIVEQKKIDFITAFVA